jgi:hypothetical protein
MKKLEQSSLYGDQVMGWMIQVLFPSRVTEFFVSLNAQTGSGVSSASISVGNGVSFWAEKHLGHEAENSLQCSDEVKN